MFVSMCVYACTNVCLCECVRMLVGGGGKRPKMVGPFSNRREKAIRATCTCFGIFVRVRGVSKTDEKQKHSGNVEAKEMQWSHATQKVQPPHLKSKSVSLGSSCAIRAVVAKSPTNVWARSREHSSGEGSERDIGSTLGA